MALNRAFFAGTCVAALALLLGGPSCRSLSLCDTPGDCAPASQTGGAAGDGAAGEQGSDGGASRGGAAGEEGTGKSVCQMPFADCDDSTLTGCETDVRWSATHCGGCGKACAGICWGGACKEGEEILEVGEVTALVSTPTHAYAISYDASGEASLLSIERRNGEPTVMTQLPNTNVTLHKGAERLYLCDNSGKVVSSIGFTGTALAPESFSADEMGTSRDGVYYRLSGELWFRSNKAGEPAAQVKGLSGSIVQLLSDGNSLVVETESEQGGVFHLMQNGAPLLLGPRPENVVALRPIDDGLVMLEPRTDDPRLQELHWLAPEEPAWTYLLDGELESEFIARLDDHAAVELQRGQAEFVFVIGRSEQEGIRIGLPPDSKFLHIDDTHVWYGDYSGGLYPRFMRAPY